MKAKSIISSLILIIFAILGGGSVKTIETMFWVMVIGPIALILAMLIWGQIQKVGEKEKQEKERLKKEAKIAEYKAQKEQFIATNGTPDKSIIIVDLDLNCEIHVYENSKKVFIMGKEYSFKDIMSCSISSRERIVRGNVTVNTESNNGSVIGRAIVGDIIAGPAGAIIGGTTAKKQTEIRHEDDKVVRNYTVNITINSISDPIISIHTGENVKLTNEIVALMNVIILNK